MSKTNTILISAFTFIFILLGIKIISIKKDEQSKLIRFQITEEISDLDFKIQLINEQIKQIEDSDEFSTYIYDQERPITVYSFHKKMKQLFGIFYNLPLKDYLNIGFVNYDTKYFMHSTHPPLNDSFFKRYGVNLKDLLYKENSSFSSKSHLFLFRKVKNTNILWFIYIDLKKNFPILYNEDLVNFELSNKKNGLKFNSGKLSENPKILSSVGLGIIKYKIKNSISGNDIYILTLLFFIYLLTCFGFVFTIKFIRSNILSKITSSLQLNSSATSPLTDITLEINKIMSEKREVEYLYKNYQNSYKILLIKEYLMDLNPNLNELSSLFDRFNSSLRFVLISSDVHIDLKKSFYSKLNQTEEFIFIDSLSNIDTFIIKEPYFQQIEEEIKTANFLIYTSEPYKSLKSSKGSWKSLISKFNKLTLINHEEFSKDTVSKKVKEKQDRMIDYIEENFRKDISLWDLAEEIGETPKYASFLFKKYTKVNFKELLTTYRINEAKRLIIDNPNVKLSALYKDVGYNSLISFTNSFKRQEKVTPSVWRDQLKKS